MKKSFALITVGFLLLTSCTTPGGNSPDSTTNLSQLQKVSVPPSTGHPHRGKPKGSNALSGMRDDMIRDSATSIGARSGLSWRARQINQVLKCNEKTLDNVYNFYGLLLPHDVLPPVLAQARNTLSLDGPDVIRLAEQTYKIIDQAHFVTTPPTWRSYIWLNYPQPDLPDKTLLPRNTAERKLWKRYVAIGWQNGVTQANNIFRAQLNRLNRDYNGMVLYLILYQENMVSSPFVAKTDLGITGDNNNMSIGDKVLRITALPKLNLEGSTWKPIVVPSPVDQRNLKAKLYQQLAMKDDGK